jgi:hypothetical protein
MVYLYTKHLNFDIFEGIGMENFGISHSYLGILRPFDVLYGPLVNFVVIWDLFAILVCCTNKNLATLMKNLSKT